VKNTALMVPEDTPFYRFARILCAVTIGATYRLHVEGAYNLPAKGPALLAVNHKNDLDPIFVGVSFRRPLRYFAKAELFRNAVLGRTVSSLGAIPVRRGESDRHALEAALACLERGEALMVFPEGTRFGDESIHEFQRGIGMLAVRSGAPVIPVAIKGSNAIFRDGRPGLPVVRLKAGPAVDLSDLQERRSAVYDVATERLHGVVEELYASV